MMPGSVPLAVRSTSHPPAQQRLSPMGGSSGRGEASSALIGPGVAPRVAPDRLTTSLKVSVRAWHAAQGQLS